MWEGGRVALLNLSNRCFVSATKDGHLFSDCNTSSPGPSWRLGLVSWGETQLTDDICLLSLHDAGPHELFDVESRDELVAFRSAHGTYVGLEAGGEKLVCSANAVGPLELFQLRLKVLKLGRAHWQLKVEGC